ncbi:hypothetical protein MGA5115_00814 [Marinomonas gallaica]|uniref:Uncharacterized protein n=1 Tax=Marinomonas gallaica TaxID=1806667 RepID=A0A1C3JNG0_9GAMM|nr:hypothetical protein MGA5115_00814 [Marinomonas gallaica]SBT20448.1 hypothetical protein MGA5116_01032 [Marinomonas gallaica]
MLLFYCLYDPIPIGEGHRISEINRSYCRTAVPAGIDIAYLKKIVKAAASPTSVSQPALVLHSMQFNLLAHIFGRSSLRPSA